MDLLLCEFWSELIDRQSARRTPEGLWLKGTPGNGPFIPHPDKTYAGIGLVEYRNGVPILSQHPEAKIGGEVHVVILERWEGTKKDAQNAKKMLKKELPDGNYVWHHEEILKVDGRDAVKMVLVPSHLNRIPHSGPASWRRFSLAIGNKALKILKPASRCVAVLGVISWIVDPLESVAAPFGGLTTLGTGQWTATMLATSRREWMFWPGQVWRGMLGAIARRSSIYDACIRKPNILSM